MTSGRRRPYIDWARGLAVLLMIEAHTLDAWTRTADRRSLAFGYANILGGFAAPLFLWLAGVGVALSMARTVERGGSRLEAVSAAIARGAEIFVLAFLFRLQAFIVSPGGHPISIFRVDILNVMGPAMAAAGVIWIASGQSPVQVTLFAAASAAVAMATPIVRASPLVDWLPLWLQWYVRPAGEFTTFTLLPWAAFVFAGAAIGVLIANSSDDRRLQRALAVVGAGLIAIGFYAAARPSIYSVPSYFWTSSPAWFAVRAGILTVTLAVLSFLPPVRILEPLAVMGRASLFVYWIHVELVYGYASWPWRHRLPLWAWSIGYVVFTFLMYRAIGLRDRLFPGTAGRILAPAAVSRA